MVKTNAVRWAELSELESVIEYELAHPYELKEQRARVVKDELWDDNKLPTENIIKVIKEVL